MNFAAGKAAAGAKKARLATTEKEQPQVESAQSLYGKREALQEAVQQLTEEVAKEERALAQQAKVCARAGVRVWVWRGVWVWVCVGGYACVPVRAPAQHVECAFCKGSICFMAQGNSRRACFACGACVGKLLQLCSLLAYITEAVSSWAFQQTRHMHCWQQLCAFAARNPAPCNGITHPARQPRACPLLCTGTCAPQHAHSGAPARVQFL
eukprot:scaffold234886_cov20-Tisochrysis_lutea.AAC.5